MVVAEKDERLKEVLRENDDQENNDEIRKKREIAAVQKEHDSALESIRARLCELQELASKYKDALAESEARNQGLLEKVADLQVSAEKMANHVDFYKDGQSREQRLVEARIQAFELSAGTEKQIELDELRSRYEQEQRDLAAFIANAFPEYINLRKELNAESIREAVIKAADALARYEKQDTTIRRLLGISKSESCEAAITRQRQ
jgi:arginine deiminase